ncbi:MAG: hypothetical protein HXX09_07515 [Bacteroidetes bacterium]|nr:hypothetical protein [Bacteroidota bacterium]
MKQIFIIIVLFTSLSGVFGQNDALKKIEGSINEKLQKYSNEGASNYWQIKILENGNIEENYGSQILSYNFNDIDSIKYLFEDEKHIVRICCRGSLNCITNSIGAEVDEPEKWDYMSFVLISKLEAENLIKELNKLKLIIPQK